MKYSICKIIILASFVFVPTFSAFAGIQEDIDMHEKYQLYLKYQKKKKYGKYKDYVEVREKYGLDDAVTRQTYKDYYEKYRLYKKQPVRYAVYARYAEQYKAYKKYQEVKDYKKYKNYKKYNNKKFDKGKKYGGSGYKAASARYVAFSHDLDNVTTNLGPEIRVGLWSKNTTDAQNDPFKVTANKAFKVTDCASTTVGTIETTANARVTYVDNSQGTLRVYNSYGLQTTDIEDKICFEAADGNNLDIIFDVNIPDNLWKKDYDHYRGKIKIQHSYTPDNAELYNDTGFYDADPGANAARRIWVINTLPLEQYLWGYGEMQGGVDNHSKALIVAARSYARWHREYGQRWKDFDEDAEENKGEGFDLLAYPQSQIYKGYDYETKYPLVPEAAKKTNGIFMKYDNEFVLGAYSSNTDGNTRALPGFPYLVSVPDPYGKVSNPGPGNHMWGMSAQGSVVLARDHGWDWKRILTYYYRNVNILKEY